MRGMIILFLHLLTNLLYIHPPINLPIYTLFYFSLYHSISPLIKIFLCTHQTLSTLAVYILKWSMPIKKGTRDNKKCTPGGP